MPRVRASDMKPEEEIKRCLGCRYVLDWLPENRCPECGRRFDPEDPTTFISGHQTIRHPLLFALTLVNPVATCLVLAYWPEYSYWDFRKYAYLVAKETALLGSVLTMLVWAVLYYLGGKEYYFGIKQRRNTSARLGFYVSVAGALFCFMSPSGL